MHFMVANEFLTTPPIFPRRWLVFKKMVSSLSVQWIITLRDSYRGGGGGGGGGGEGGLPPPPFENPPPPLLNQHKY